VSGSRSIEVALPLPLFRTFTYEVPEGLPGTIAPGARVVVPLRSGREIGICVSVGGAALIGAGASGTGRAARGVVRPILEAPDDEPAITPSLLTVARRIAEYYLVPAGVVLRGMLPSLLAGAAAPDPAPVVRRIVTLAREMPSLLERDTAFARARRQRELLELLESLGGRAPVTLLLERLGASRSVLEGLAARGLVTVSDEPAARDPFASRAIPAAAPHVPTSAQRSAIDAIAASAPGDVCLLHGVTGSGKTLVYIEALRRVVLDQGRSAIVLVPEIALTPQTVDRFRAVFGDQVAVLHSALSDGERLDAWRALRQGQRRIAVGARSAVFAPLDNVGVIIVDEEHEATYKQSETPRYHAREVAIMRAREEGAVVVLGSATPSVESWSHASSGRFRLLTLPERVGRGTLPAIEVVDLRHREARGRARAIAADALGVTAPPDGAPRAAPRVAVGTVAGASTASLWPVLSEPMEHALRDRLARGEQSLLLLNRRGYAAFVQCLVCGEVTVCPNCSITLTYHRTPERMVCHYCLHQEPPGERCARCSGLTLKRRGVGTQQVERMLAEHFPAARIARMDVDTTSGKWAHAEILDRVAAGAVDILLGTQMIAKGLDFPNVTFVGVIDADVGVNLPDFRASERCFQLLSQVAGRAGRGPKGGTVIIQTRLPAHHAVRCAVTHDYVGFVTQEIAGRREPVYPPFTRLVHLIFSATSEEAASALARAGADWLRRLIAERAPGAVHVVGAAPCPVERIKTRWRWRVLLKGEHAADLTRVGRYFLARFVVPRRDDLRVVLDRDPVSLM
jgi:primosomal protein N' (replication factor Y)